MKKLLLVFLLLQNSVLLSQDIVKYKDGKIDLIYLKEDKIVGTKPFAHSATINYNSFYKTYELIAMLDGGKISGGKFINCGLLEDKNLFYKGEGSDREYWYISWLDEAKLLFTKREKEDDLTLTMLVYGLVQER